jgi:hypothetical protein
MTEENERIRCLYVGARIGRSIHDIATSALNIHEAPIRYRVRSERDHHVELDRAALRSEYEELRAAVDRARTLCGWYDDSEVGHGVDRLLSVGPAANVEDIFEELGQFTGDPGLAAEENDAVYSTNYHGPKTVR